MKFTMYPVSKEGPDMPIHESPIDLVAIVGQGVASYRSESKVELQFRVPPIMNLELRSLEQAASGIDMPASEPITSST